MNADDILNNMDPNEIRNLIRRLKPGRSVVSNIIINQAPNQYPPTDTTPALTDESERYLAVYNYYFGATTSIGYGLGLATSPDSRNWTIKVEPVIPRGSGGQFDSYTHQFPWLLQVDGVLYLYFAGKNGNSWANFKIGLARSFDGGSTWEKYASNPIIDNTAGWENSNVFEPVVLYDPEETNASKRWKMWYSASSFGQGVGYAYSADGLSWTKSSLNPVMTLGTSGQWDDTYISPHAVLRRGDEFILFYGGKKGAMWASGYATFTDPEGAYTRSADNPILIGDGITSTLSADLVAGSATATVSDATVFPIGCPVWIGGTTRFLTHVTKRISSTSIELADAVPATIASGQIVRSVAYNSVDIRSVFYDDGYKMAITPHQPDELSESGVHETTMWAYANDDLKEVFIDYGAGIQIPISVAESQSQSVTRENWSILDTWDFDANRHKPALYGDMLKSTYDPDDDGIVADADHAADADTLQGHPASDFLVPGDIFNDSEGNPEDVSTGTALDGISDHAARRDHVHHFTETGSGGGHLHGLARWAASSSQTTFELPDIAEYLEGVTDNGVELDTIVYSLSSDRTQLVLDAGATAGHIIQSSYVVANI